MSGKISPVPRDEDAAWMREALRLAERAGSRGEVPVGAVVVRGGRALGRGTNRRESRADPTHHAEIEALRRAAARSGSWRLDGATLYVTLEPCAMCAGACVNARIARIVYGCSDPKAGYVESLGAIATDSRLNHRCSLRGGVLADQSAELLRRFFRERRGGATGEKKAKPTPRKPRA
ncbi:MAG TPA: tRNA adenosine(34) deaminase TadA [Thermoanaerobaculia bacterium]|nr:tRNA adenosine(34) deaminase TadA [Thermoanaerobaculia bacterium]